MTKQLRTTTDVENKIDNREPIKVDSEKVDSSKPLFVADEMKDGLASVLSGLEKMCESTMNKSSIIWLIKPVMEFLVRKEHQLDRLGEELERLSKEGSERELNNFIEYRLVAADELKLYAAWTGTFGDLYDALILESGLLDTHTEYNLKTVEDMRRDVRDLSNKTASDKREKLLATAKAYLK